jgi:hypothetical protein
MPKGNKFISCHEKLSVSKKLINPSHYKLASLLAAVSLAGISQQGFAAGAPAPNTLPTGGKVTAGAAVISIHSKWR